MSVSPVSCNGCGAKIPEEDLETGSAISVLGRSFCSSCKGKAVQDISLDDLLESDSPPPRAARPPFPAPAPPRPAAPRPSPPPPVPPPRNPPASRRPETARLKVARLRPRSRAPLVAGALAAALAVAATAVLVSRNPDPGPQAGPRVPPVPGPPEPLPPPPRDARTEKAETAYTAAEILARRSDRGYDEILASIEQSRPACRGTPFEARLEELRNRVLREKEVFEGTKAFNGLVEELRAAVASDSGFARYAELVPKFEKARELAARAAPERISEVSSLHQDYSGRYRKAAESHYAEIREYADTMVEEKRYDLALRKIDTFPVHLRHSGAWKILDQLRAEIERRKAGSK